MANSSIVTALKEAVINEIIHDEQIFYAIDSPDITTPKNADLLVYEHIFPYHMNPENLTREITLLTVQVQIPKTLDDSNIWVVPRLEIWIITHINHMRTDNIPPVTDNRNDYISKLIDKKLNGRDTLGTSKNDADNLHLYGRLNFVSNTEGVFSKDYLYRQMIFEMKDVNHSFCDEK